MSLTYNDIIANPEYTEQFTFIDFETNTDESRTLYFLEQEIDKLFQFGIVTENLTTHLR